GGIRVLGMVGDAYFDGVWGCSVERKGFLAYVGCYLRCNCQRLGYFTPYRVGVFINNRTFESQCFSINGECDYCCRAVIVEGTPDIFLIGHREAAQPVRMPQPVRLCGGRGGKRRRLLI